MFKRYLLHDRLWVRFGALFAAVLIALLVVWTSSYFFLPEGILRERNVAQVLAGKDLAGGSVWLEWLRILAINLGVMLVLVVMPNLFRSEGNYPLGYGTVILIAAVFGITLGTNSFSVSVGGKLPPTVAILESSGIYEIAAYTLASTATITIGKCRLVGKWPRQTVEKLTSCPAPSALRERNVGMIVSVAVLVTACAWEAYRFSLVVAP